MTQKYQEHGHKFTDFNLSDLGPDLKADLRYKDDNYTVIMYDDSRSLLKSWERVGYEPRCGVDVADYDRANEVIEEIIKEWFGEAAPAKAEEKEGKAKEEIITFDNEKLVLRDKISVEIIDLPPAMLGATVDIPPAKFPSLLFQDKLTIDLSGPHVVERSRLIRVLLKGDSDEENRRLKELFFEDNKAVIKENS